MKTTFKAAACTLFLCMSLTACDSFLNGGQAKNEIEETIAYNNAKNITVSIMPEVGTGTAEPSGKVSVKQGYFFDISFTEASDSCFIRWKAVLQNTSTEVTDGVVFEDATALKTRVKIQNDKDSIQLVPECKARISLDGEPTPKYNSFGESRDSPIVVTFTQKLDPSNFIFSNGEYPKDAQVKQDANGKIWAYTFNGQTFFKNISITNSDGYSIAEYFDQPKIDDTGKTLTIGTNLDKLIPFNANETLKTIVVTLSENIQNAEYIIMGSAKSWRYLINDSTNEKAYPTVSATTGSGSLDGPAAGTGFSINQTISISFTVKEGFKFEQWSASSVFLPEGEVIDDYVVFGDRNSPSTTVTFLKPLYDIRIVAECPKLPFFNLELTGSNGKFSPVKGKKECIQTFSYPVSFEPDRDYEFIKWEIYDSVTNEVFENGKYLTIADPTEATTTYSFAAKPGSNINLALRPVIADRPQIISNSPTGSGVFRDSTIQVLFDTDMDPASIYFDSEKEIPALKAEGITQLLLVAANEPQNIDDVLEDIKTGAEPKVYGYIKNGETYFKNIMIRNKNTQKNINNCFVQPFFENASTLSIAAYKASSTGNSSTPTYNEVLPDYTQIIVCIEKGFFYTAENGKPVEMAGSRKWMYQVSSGDDSKPMIVNNQAPYQVNYSDNFAIGKYSSYTVTQTTEAISALKKMDDNKLKLKLEVGEESGGSGPGDFFTINLQRIYDDKYETIIEDSIPYPVYYQEVTTETAKFDGTVDMTGWNLKDGVYAMNFTFADRSNNLLTYPTVSETGEGDRYYFVVNNSGPDIAFPNKEQLLDENNTPYVKFLWPANSATLDLSGATVEYKKKNASTWSEPQSVNYSVVSPILSIENLDFSTEYDFKITYTDFDSKKTELQKTFVTQPSMPLNLRVKSYTYNSVTWEWDPPEGLAVSGYDILVIGRHETGGGFNGIVEGINDTTFTVTNLATLDITGARVRAYNDAGLGLFNEVLYTRTGPVPRNIISCYTASDFDYIEIRLDNLDYLNYDYLDIFVEESQEALETATPKYTYTLSNAAHEEYFLLPREDFIRNHSYYVKTRVRFTNGGKTLYGDSNIRGFYCR